MGLYDWLREVRNPPPPSLTPPPRPRFQPGAGGRATSETQSCTEEILELHHIGPIGTAFPKWLRPSVSVATYFQVSLFLSLKWG